MDLVCLARAKLLTTLSEISPAPVVQALLRDTKKTISAFGDSQAAADFHTRAAQIEATRGDFPKAREHLKAARSYLESSPNKHLEGSLDLAASAVHFRASDLSVARRFAESALKLSLCCGHARMRMAATANLGLLDLHLGNLAKAEEEMIAALDLSNRFPVSQLSLLDNYAQLELVRGRTERCRELLTEIDKKIQTHEPSVFSWQQLAVGTTRVRLLLALRDWRQAQTLARSLSEAADKKSDLPHRVTFRLLGADALLETEGFDEAARLVNEAAELANDAPLALSVEVERVQAAVLARTTDPGTARRRFDRALRILSSIGGIAPRMDAALSFERTMDPSADLVRAIREQPWNLEPLIARSPQAMQPGDESSESNDGTRRRPVAIDVSDAVTLGRLASTPQLLAREASVLLRDSGRVRAVATVERRKDGSRRVLTNEGWSKEEAQRGAAQTSGEVKIPLGESDDADLELVVAPRDGVQATAFLRDFDTMVRQWRSLQSFQTAERAQQSLTSSHEMTGSHDGVFISKSMRGLAASAKQIAKTPIPVLITGETGTGKEVLARLIHRHSDRSSSEFLPFNCTGVPKDMVESQFFGHRRGAFTGAQDDALGIIRSAEGGTLFLDEIGDIEPEIQPKLLRFLDNYEVHPLGETRPRPVDVRIIAATNADLDSRVREGRFREDLLYRLNTITLEIPPLRTRREEILPLAHHFLKRAAENNRRNLVRITEEAQKCLLVYEWPGNVRELDNVIKGAVALASPDSPIGLQQFSPQVVAGGRSMVDSVESAATEPTAAISIPVDQPLAQAVGELERQMIVRVLDATDGQYGPAARRLGLSRKGLYLKRQRLGLDDLTR